MSTARFVRVAAVAAVLALASSTPARAGDVPFDELLQTASIDLSPVPASQGPPVTPPVPHKVKLDLGRVPNEEIPPPLDLASAPSRVPEGTLPGSLRFADVTKFQLARYKANRAELVVHIESAESGVGAGYLLRNGVAPALRPSSRPRARKTPP